MVRKMWLSGIVVGAIIVSELFMFAIRTFFSDAADAAVNGSPYTGNFTGLTPALQSSPLWLYFLPPFVGLIAIILILRQPEN